MMNERLSDLIDRVEQSATRFLSIRKLTRESKPIPPEFLLRNEARLLTRRAFSLWIYLKTRHIKDYWKRR